MPSIVYDFLVFYRDHYLEITIAALMLTLVPKLLQIYAEYRFYRNAHLGEKFFLLRWIDSLYVKNQVTYLDTLFAAALCFVLGVQLLVILYRLWRLFYKPFMWLLECLDTPIYKNPFKK